MTTCYARLFYTLWSSKMPFSPLFVTYCRIDIFRVLRQSFCGKFEFSAESGHPGYPLLGCMTYLLAHSGKV